MEYEYLRLLYTKEEIEAASNDAYRRYISTPHHDPSVENHRRWWPNATCIPPESATLGE